MLVGLGILFLLQNLGVVTTGWDLIMALLFALGGVLFVTVFLGNRDHWWAVIPGGVLLTLALVASLADIAGGEAVGGFFFLGLAATFGVVYLLPTPEGRMKWAIIPAAILGAMGVLITLAASPFLNYLWPVALVSIGLFLIYRSLVSRQA